MTDVETHNPPPLPSPIKAKFDSGKDFHASCLIGGRKAVRVALRVNGQPYVIDIGLIDRQVEFQDPSALNVETFSVPDKLGRLKARAVLENITAFERIQDFCLECEHFSWSGKAGPYCDRSATRGCQCKELKDPDWHCPIGKF